jgi:hypothetical protein
LNLIGETLHPGKYRFYSGIEDNLIEEDDLDEEAILDPRLYSQLRSQSQSQAQTPQATNENSEGEDTQPETTDTKRHRESATIEQPPAKKKKASGLGVMQGVSDGMLVLAEAFKESLVEKVAKDTVDSTIEGQAQLKVLEEVCLTNEGQLVMIELLSNPTLARTYMVFLQKDELRIQWLKKQLEKNGGNIADLFIN